MTTSASLLFRIRPDAPAAEVAWNEFHERYAPIINGFARKLGARPQDLCDIVQDVLVGFFAVSPTFIFDPAKGRFRSYLKTCTFRAIRNRMAKNVRFEGLPVDEVDPADHRLDEAWNDIWETEKLRKAIDVVRDEYSVNPKRAKTFQAFEMYVLLERPADDVAQDLGIRVASVHTAKTRICRAINSAVKGLEQVQGQ